MEPAAGADMETDGREPAEATEQQQAKPAKPLMAQLESQSAAAVEPAAGAAADSGSWWTRLFGSWWTNDAATQEEDLLEAENTSQVTLVNIDSADGDRADEGQTKPKKGKKRGGGAKKKG